MRGVSPRQGPKVGLAFERSGGSFALSLVLFDVEIVLKSICFFHTIKPET